MEALLNVIDEYKAYGLLAFVVTVFATPLAAFVARRLGVMDVPDQKLKPHTQPTPYLGGAAICLGWAAALALALIVIPHRVDTYVLVPIVLGGIAMSVLGLLDDVCEMPPFARIALGAAIIALVIVYTGVADRVATSFLSQMHIGLPSAVTFPLSLLLGLFIVLGACNSANLIDGLDGLCAGVTAIISLGFFAIAAYLAIEQYSREANALRLLMVLAMIGASLGFLPLNFNPAKIFLGDSGSMLLGYNCGIMILLFDERGQLRWMLGGLMVFGLPIFDTALAIVRRWRSGRPIFMGDRSHFYDQLVDRGMSVRKVVLISYLLAAFYAALGCTAIWLRLRYIVPLYAVVAIATAVVIHLTGMARAEATPAPEAAGDAPDA
jgi:UDP-GlcNAc:undecaprenyl-phosphate GlcNAc-1-phosphate transferase